MNTKNKYHYMKHILYKLKMQFGDNIQIYTPETKILNTQTGVTVQPYSLINIQRAIPTPSKLNTIFKYSKSFVSTNRQFAEGGFFDTEIKDFLIDAKDLPSGFVLTTQQYIIHQDKRYNIKEIDNIGNGTAYIVIAQQTLGDYGRATYSLQVFDFLNLVEDMSND